MESAALIKGLEKVTGKWCKQRKREERDASALLNRRYAMTRRRQVTIKEAAWQVMETAYMKASANCTLPAHARQIMYAARGEILRLTERDHLNDAYFTQTILPDYINEHPEARSWDIVYDARGHFAEPHAHKGEVVPLGTISVRNYLRKQSSHCVDPPEAEVNGGDKYPTCGPRNRFGAVLFIEKEGFMPLFEKVKLAERYDIAIMSTKGVSNIASRQLVDRVCSSDCPLLVLHDFDVDGFKILASLQRSTRRFQFSGAVNVIDLGLRLADVEQYALESEDVHRSSYSDTTMLTYGATATEIKYLQNERVELNAFASDELIEWLEGKFDQHGVKKVIPDRDTQADAYRRAVEVVKIEQAIAAASAEVCEGMKEVDIPDDLEETIRLRLKEDPSITWDQAVVERAREALDEDD